ncbi:MAG: hypothetical protein ACTSSH_01490 [Candidatus Heimdallarchaeota archaeon]
MKIRNSEKAEIRVSLAKTIDSLNECLFYNKSLPKKELNYLFKIINDRQMHTGKNIGQISLTPNDYVEGSRLFTGEKLHTKLAVKNILTQETFRVISISDEDGTHTNGSLELANKWLTESCFAEFCSVGECSHSTIGYMRYLNTFKPKNTKKTLITFIELLKQHRNKRKRWDGFPFYYTLLALSEIHLVEAKNELQLALPACEKRISGIERVNVNI